MYNKGDNRSKDGKLNESVLHVLKQHEGSDKAISRDDLISLINGCYLPAGDRAIRQAINDLRHEGYPICSTGGTDGGYWWAKDNEELYEFLHREVEPRIADLSEQRKAMMLYAMRHTVIQPHLLEVEA